MKKMITSTVTSGEERPIRHSAQASRSVSRALDPGELLDGREERIRELKRQIDARIYVIDSYKIAARMLARTGDCRDVWPQIRC